MLLLFTLLPLAELALLLWIGEHTGWEFTLGLVILTGVIGAWLARQESIRKGKAVKLGMEKAKAKGKAVGRPVVVDRVDADLVGQLRSEGRIWREIADVHPILKSANGRKVKPSVGSIRRAYQACQKAEPGPVFVTE